MIYECDRVKMLWKLIAETIKCNIMLKTIICGWPTYDISRKLNCFNVIISVVANAIFRMNSKCKFESLNYSNVDLKGIITKSLLYQKSIIKCFREDKMLILYINKITDMLNA